MKTITRTLMLLTLVCYLAVSSIATVHAFPSFNDQSDITQTEQDLLPSVEMQSNCHQNVDKSSSATSVSLCELFCSAMGNVIANELFIEAELVHLTQEIQSLILVLSTRQLSLEPHPPK